MQCSLVKTCRYVGGFIYFFFKTFDYSNTDEADRSLLQNCDNSVQRNEHHNLPDLTDDAVSNMR
jgi:hypothetical protein